MGRRRCTVGGFGVTYLVLHEEITARHRADAAERVRGQREAIRLLRDVCVSVYQEVSRAGSSLVPRAVRYGDLATSIDNRAFRIDDDELRDRLISVQSVAETLAMGEEDFDRSAGKARPTTWELGTVRFHRMLQRLIWSLEASFKEGPLPEWESDLPRAAGARAWILEGET